MVAALCIAAMPLLWGGAVRAQVTGPLSPVPAPSSVRPASDAPAMSIGLAEAVAIGMRDNRSIRAAFIDRGAQRYALAAAERRFSPRLDLLADVYRSDSGDAAITEASVSGTGSWLLPTGAQIGFVWDRRERLGGSDSTETATLVVTQPLLRGAGVAVNRAPVRIARLGDAINRLALKNSISETISAIIFAYRRLQQAQEQVRLAEIALRRTGMLIDTNRAMIEAGRMAPADIVQSEANYANQEVILFQTRQDLVSAQYALLELLAIDPGINIVAADPIDAEHVPIDIATAVEFARDNRMDLLSQQRTVESAREALRIARNNRLWDLSVVAAATRNGGRDAYLGVLPTRTDGRVGLQLAIPLGDPGPELVQVQADAALRTAELQLDTLDQRVEAQVYEGAQRIETAWRQLQAARRFRELASQAVENERAKLAAGRSSNFQLLSLQDDQRIAEIQELTATIAYLNALTSFDLQIGATLASWKIDWSDK